MAVRPWSAEVLVAIAGGVLELGTRIAALSVYAHLDAGEIPEIGNSKSRIKHTRLFRHAWLSPLPRPGTGPRTARTFLRFKACIPPGHRAHPFHILLPAGTLSLHPVRQPISRAAFGWSAMNSSIALTTASEYERPRHLRAYWGGSLRIVSGLTMGAILRSNGLQLRTYVNQVGDAPPMHDGTRKEVSFSRAAPQADAA